MKRRVLIIDDSAANRMAFTKILVDAGFEISEACSGLEGLLKIRPRPDVILLDVNLPDMSGFEVCKRFKNSELREIPIIQTSATFVTQHDFLEGAFAGADKYLISPVDPMLLVDCVNSVLSELKDVS